MTSNNMPRIVGLVGGLCVLALALPVAAHPGAGAPAGMGAAFAHPFTGIDHLLALIAAGLWAGQQQAARRWRLPVGLLGCMAVAAICGAFAGAVTEIEAALAMSLMASGLLLALPRAPAGGAAIVLSGGVAAAHGYVHGVEVLSAGLVLPLLALLTASALIVGGAAVAANALTGRGATPLRIAGLAIAGVGGLLLGA